MTLTIMPRVQTSAARVLGVLYTVCALLFFLALAYHHYHLATFSFPLDYNEAGMLSITETIVEGRNPYSLESQPINTSVYPALYNTVVAPLSVVFGNDLVLHRTVTALFILGSCLLLFILALRESRSPQDSFAAACIFYSGLLYYSTPIAGPNGMGVMLFLASIALPWLYNFSNRSLFIAIVLGILAFYTKQYFVASLGFIALYLFLAVSKARALIFGSCALLLFLGVLTIVHLTSPYFLDNALFAQASAAAMASTNNSLLKQFTAFGQLYLPIFLILCVALILRFSGNHATEHPNDMPGRSEKIKNSINLRDMRAPLINVPVNYFWYCFLCSLTIIVVSLGKNAGNHLSYFFQLLSPFLLVGIVALASTFKRSRWLFHILMIAAFYKSFAILQHDFTVNDGNWKKIRAEMSSAGDIYASTLLLADIIESGKPYYENGHTRYFVLANNKPKLFEQKNPDATPARIWAEHVRRIRQKLEAQEFDLILLDQWMVMPEDSSGGESSMQLLEKRYYRSESLKLSLAKRPGGGTYTIQVWKPRLDLDKEQKLLND